MKPIKMFGLAALAALIAMAIADASSAMATGSTALCEEDEAQCANPLERIHEESVGKAQLLGPITVECNVLFLGDALNHGLATPLAFHGNFTYTNCGSCTVKEENGPAQVKFLKTGHETATVTMNFLLKVVCSGIISCGYNAVGLLGTYKGPLLSTQANGDATLLGQTLNKEAGCFLGPTTIKLDIVTTPLEPTYVST